MSTVRLPETEGGAAPRRLVSRAELRAYGFPFSAMGLWRMMKRGDFPRPVRLGGRNFWYVHELDAFIARLPRVEQRSAADAA